MAEAASSPAVPRSKTRPRTAGRFDTSEAKKKRKAKGIAKAPKGQQASIIRAAKMRRRMPDAPAELIKKTAEAVVTLEESPMVVEAFSSRTKQMLGQSLMQSQAIRLIHDALPHAARYLVRLVKGDGDCATAPHSVRRQAAVDLLTLGRIGEGSAAAGKELSEMTADELQAFIANTKQELNSRADKAKVVQGEVVEADAGRVPDNLSGTTGNRFRDIDLT